jgi:hypothetical protein
VTVEQVDARKATLKAGEALALLKDVDTLYATKGKQVIRLDLKPDAPETAALTGLLLGPTGNLRAPTLRVGRTLLVGFDEATYNAILAGS